MGFLGFPTAFSRRSTGWASCAGRRPRRAAACLPDVAEVDGLGELLRGRRGEVASL